MGSLSLCAKPAKVAASSNNKANLASRGNKANKAVSSNKLVVAKAVKASLVSRVNPVLHLVKVRDKVNKDSLKVKVLVELVNSNTTTTKAAKVAVKADSSKVKADRKIKATAKVKTSSSNSKVTEMVTNHAQTAEVRDTLTLTVKRHHTRLGIRLRKTSLKKLVAKWLQLMQLNKLSQMQFRTLLRCLASQLRASSRAVLLPATSSTASYEAAVSQVSSLSVLSL